MLHTHVYMLIQIAVMLAADSIAWDFHELICELFYHGLAVYLTYVYLHIRPDLFTFFNMGWLMYCKCDTLEFDVIERVYIV